MLLNGILLISPLAAIFQKCFVITDWDEDGGFPSEILELTNLENLYLYNQAFRKIPSRISNLKKLTNFELSNCYQLSSLHESIGQLPNLKGKLTLKFIIILKRER